MSRYIPMYQPVFYTPPVKNLGHQIRSYNETFSVATLLHATFFGD